MIFLYALVGLAAAVALLCAVARPGDERSRCRAEVRRRRYVARHPIYVNSHDILCALVLDGVEPDQARLVTDRAAKLEIAPYTMWLWIQRFDAVSLAIVVAADLSHEQVLAHYSTGRLPDLQELRVFAACNGLRPAEPVRHRRVLVDSSVSARRRTAIPPIFEPGTWPASGRATGADNRRTSGERRRRGGLAA